MKLGFALLVVPTSVWVAWLVTGFNAGPFEGFLDRWIALVALYGAVLACFARAALIPGGRRVPFLLGLALLLWTLGDTHFRVVSWNLETVPVPSPADAGYLLCYPLAYAAIALLLRDRIHRIDRSVWIDGAIGGLAVAAVTAAVVLDAVLESLGGELMETVVNLIYPLADMVLLAMVVGGLALSGWRLDRTWLWIGGGLTLFAIADAFYLYGVAKDTYVPGSIVDAGWSLAALMIAWAAWQPSVRAEALPAGRWRIIAMPIGLSLVALTVLVAGSFGPALNTAATALAAACLLAVLGRLVITYSQNVEMLTESRTEAATDPLTGLGNRRKLMLDVERVTGRASHDQPVMLALFDLNGFKQYNDTFGHPAGDALLLRLGRGLAAAMGEHALCFRMGGDEFCVLAEIGAEDVDPWLQRAAGALSDHGEGFTVSCAYGAALVPLEAHDAAEALRLADRRMYSQKNSGRASARRQSTDVLLQALQESDPALGEHLGGVARLAEATARALDMDRDEIDQVRIAGELHDVGKMAIPDAILDKPGPLDEHEWEFVRGHSAIGERIVAAAPSLAGVAKLVRCVHEHWNGGGYPDGLSSQDIPLGARVVSVSDAFHAMISDRPYRSAMSVEAALAELRACAGTQFDPRVVEAFCSVQSAEPSTALAA